MQKEPLAWIQNRASQTSLPFNPEESPFTGRPWGSEPLGSGLSRLWVLFSLSGACGSGLLLPQGCPGELFHWDQGFHGSCTAFLLSDQLGEDLCSWCLVLADLGERRMCLSASHLHYQGDGWVRAPGLGIDEGKK